MAHSRCKKVETDEQPPRSKALGIVMFLALVNRLCQSHPTIERWDKFRYDVLPDELADCRVALERMVIRDVATLMTNRKSVSSLTISDYTLTNERVDA